VSVIRDSRFGIGRTVPATRDTRVRIVVLVYCQARAAPNDRLRPNAAMTVDYRVGQGQRVNTSVKAGAQIPHLPLGDDSSPWGR
jgi:hypothetical protein